jgi:hypothetical protein
MSLRLSIPITLAGAIGLVSTVSAADLTDAEIKSLISGKTVYLDIGGGGSVTGATGAGVIFYAADGNAVFKTPKGEMWTGKWSIKGNQGCVEWKQATANACTRYDKQGETITLINVATGQPRGKIVKTAEGNAEKLAP